MYFKVISSVSEIGKENWELLIQKRFFLSYDYLYALELACDNLEYRYVLGYEKDEFFGLFYYQIIPFKGENLKKYLPNSTPILKSIFSGILSIINTQLLVLGNVIFTCENGVFLKNQKVVDAESLVHQSLDHAYRSLKRKPLGTMISENIQQVSSRLFCIKKFHIFKVEDRMELDLSNFQTFDSYKSALHSKYRVRMNKVYELNQKTKIQTIDKSNYHNYSEDIKRLFNQVLDNSKFKITKISDHYFLRFIENVERFKMKGFFIEDKLIGFVSYFSLNTVIEVHYIGLDYSANHSHKLYNFILYAMIEESYRLGVNKICFGRTAQELKSTLGAKPYSTLSSLKINLGMLNLMTPIFLRRMVPELWTPRHPFKN